MFAVLLFAVALDSPQAVSWYAVLLQEGGYGRFERERAAFLIEEEGGALTLEPWPAGSHKRASFRGRVPSRAIAIIHTHPLRERMPSAHDRGLARRIGIPVLVITPGAVVAAMPEGPDVTLLKEWLPR